MAIVTIWYDTSTPGPEVGMLLASRLHYRYVDQRLIVKAAHRLRHLGETLRPGAPDELPLKAERRRYIASIRAALYELAKDDNVVLMDQGAASVLRWVPHALRVRIISERTPLPAVAGGGPYDVTINRERLSTAAIVDVVSEVLGQPGRATTEVGIQHVKDAALASLVQLALATNAWTGRHRIGVEAQQGTVRLESAEILDPAVEVAREVPGVSRVIMRSTRAALSR